jgi:hypothetical protein
MVRSAPKHTGVNIKYRLHVYRLQVCVGGTNKQWNITYTRTQRQYVIRSTSAHLDNWVLFHNLRSRNLCSRTQVTRWTTRCVKGFLSFNPLAFTHVPPDVTTSAARGVAVWRCVHNIYGLFWWRISDFRLSCVRFLLRKWKLILRISELSANETKTHSLSGHSLKGRVLEVSPWRVRVEGQSGRIKRVWSV